MPELRATAEPLDVGLDPRRLERIATHFDAYVADGRLAGYVASVARGGETAWVRASGMADAEAARPMGTDTVFRLFSMTKPVTAVAVMRLIEQGCIELTDEVAPIIGAFAEPRVFVGGSEDDLETERSAEPIRIWHLLTHTAGMTYGFQYSHVVDALYRRAGYELGWPPGKDLAGACEDLSAVPLLFEPGAAWNYSISFDVLGRVIECVTGETLDVALDHLVLEPLGMTETAFWAPEPLHDRLAQLYVTDGNRALSIPELGAHTRHRPTLLGGGGGLVSTPHDFKRFTGMLLGAGELDGVRLLSERAIADMTRNHLPGGVDLAEISRDDFAEIPYVGMGYGLGFGVVLDAVRSGTPATEGSFIWGGAASTAFWVDPAEGLEVSFFTQLLPSSTYQIRSELSQLVHAALVD